LLRGEPKLAAAAGRRTSRSFPIHPEAMLLGELLAYGRRRDVALTDAAIDLRRRPNAELCRGVTMSWESLWARSARPRRGNSCARRAVAIKRNADAWPRDRDHSDRLAGKTRGAGARSRAISKTSNRSPQLMDRRPALCEKPAPSGLSDCCAITKNRSQRCGRKLEC